MLLRSSRVHVKVVVAVVIAALAPCTLLVSSAAAAPLASLQGFQEGLNPAGQHAVGSTMWIDPAAAGSFTIRVAATDPGPGVQHVAFPSLGGSWSPLAGLDTTGPSPYEYTYSWLPGAPSVLGKTAVATSLDGTSASVTFDVLGDSSTPINGAIAVPSVVTSDTSIDIGRTLPIDSQSGVAGVHVERRQATYAAGTCAAFGSWAQVGPASPPSPWSDTTTVDGHCYEYRLRAVDGVGNVARFASSNRVRVDRTAPSGTVDASPLSPFVGVVGLTGTAADTGSGAASVDVRYAGPGSGDICLAAAPAASWSCAWNTSTVVPGVYTVSLIVTDAAGNQSASVTRTVVVAAAQVDVDVDISAGTALAEDGSIATTFDVVLRSAPTGAVTIAVVTDTQVAVGVPALVFTPATWNVPQRVAVTAVDDAAVEASPHPGYVQFATASTDPGFDLLAVAAIGFDITDDDTATLDLDVADGVWVNEAGSTSDTFTVALASAPSSAVTLAVAGDAQVVAAPSNVTFTPTNWATPQLVTVAAVDDALDEANLHPGAVTLTATSTDPAYQAMATATVTASVLDDESFGSATATFGGIVEADGAPFQHASGSTVWFNPAFAGSFRVVATGAALPSLESMIFPGMLTPGWSSTIATVDQTVPFSQLYAWGPSAQAPGPRTLTAMSSGGQTGSAGFTIAADAAPPQGTAIIAQSAVTRDTTVPLSATVGVDALSGVGSWQYERRLASLASSACGPWGAWAGIGAASPSGAINDATTVEACIQYRVVVSDRVGNAEIATQNGELRVDRTAPEATIDPVDGRGLHGVVKLGGTAADAVTRLRSVTVSIEDRYSICSNAPVNAAGRWSCTWTIPEGELGPATIKVMATDLVGYRTSATRSVTVVKPPSPFGPREHDVDRTPPIVGLARIPLVSWGDGVKVKATAFDDRPGFVEVRMEQQSASASAARFSQWRPSFEESEVVALEDNGETMCFRAVAVDLMGNRATSAPRCTTRPIDDADFGGRGDWDDVPLASAWLGSLRRSASKGASLSIRVADTNPVLVVHKCRACGALRVFHGSRVVGTWSTHAKRSLPRQSIQLPALRQPTSAPLRIVALTAKPIHVDALAAAR